MIKLTPIPVDVEKFCPINYPSEFDLAQDFIEHNYLRVFGARIHADFPTIMTVVDDGMNIQCAAGLRTSAEPFYLEHYLNHSAEQSLSQYYGRAIDRNTIVEIGNLAGGESPRATYYLMHQLWRFLAGSDIEHVMLTCTKPLRRRFRYLPLHQLVDADPKCIPDSTRWGSYYSLQPHVMTGLVHDYDMRFRRHASTRELTTRILNP